VWFKVDDGLTSSRKVLRIPRAHRAAAMGLWVLAGSWAGQELTDGHVPAYMPDELAGDEQLALHLVAVGLWHHAGDEECPAGDERCTAHRPARMDDGWWFHDWKQANPVRSEVEAERDAAAERMRNLRAKRAGKRSPEVRPNTERTSQNFAGSAPEVPNPDPTRTEPALPSEVPNPPSLRSGSPSTRKRAERGTRLPEDWRPDEELANEMRAELGDVLDLYAEHRKFMDYWTNLPGAKGVKLDWRKTWRNWMRSAAERGSSPIRPTNGHTVAPGGFDPAAALARARAAQEAAS